MLLFWLLLSSVLAHYMDVDEEAGETNPIAKKSSFHNVPLQNDLAIAMEPSTEVQTSCCKPVIAFSMVTMGIVFGLLLALLFMWLAHNYF